MLAKDKNSITRNYPMTAETSQLSAPVASIPVKKMLSREVPGKKVYQRGSPVRSSASPPIFKFHYFTVFLLFPSGKWSKLFPGKSFKVHLAGMLLVKRGFAKLENRSVKCS